MLKINNLHWFIQNKSILKNISFYLAKGEMLGVIGCNGAGKSSLLRCLYRYIAPQQGEILLNGNDTKQLSHRAFAKKVAVVQQDMPINMELTTYQLVALGLSPHKGLFELASQHDKRIILAAINKVGLSTKISHAFNHLSGGEKQRALIARAMVQQPELLILDEPTNHLDIRYQIQILKLIKNLGISVIASIHDLNLASAFCDKLLMLDKGQVVAYGTPQEVLTEDRISQIFGVCCTIVPHPQHKNPLINYFYGDNQNVNS